MLITFEFCELPLVVDLGFEAGLVSGSADIHAHDGGEWFVDKIYLDGARLRTIMERAIAQAGGVNLGMFERRPVELDRSSAIYLAILDQLENGRFRSSVEDAISEDRAAAADEAADQRREARLEHSTLNRAQQGC